MFAPLFGRYLIQLMVIFYTALVCTTIFQSTLMERTAPSHLQYHEKEWWALRQNFASLKAATAPLSSTGTKNSTILNPSPSTTTNNQHQTTSTTLALLYPPGIVGGYRNQVMRFLGLLHYAKIHNIRRLLLPTLLWTTTYKEARDEKKFYPLPMAKLFDVEHWNSFSDQLPVLVETLDGGGIGDCWQPHNDADSSSSSSNSSRHDVDPLMMVRPNSDTPRTTFVSPAAREVLRSSAILSPVKNITTEILTGALSVNTRKLDLWSEVEHCNNPRVYGGGKGAGRLWNDYVRLLKAHPPSIINRIESETDPEALETMKLISLVSKALQPAKMWRDVAHNCVRDRQKGQSTTTTKGDYNEAQRDVSENIVVAPYVALHARVEVDMLIHRCSKTMEKNLTTILNMVEAFQEQNELSFGSIPVNGGVFLAVSRRGMLHPTKEEWVQPLLKENWKALNLSGNRTTNFFECGEDMMQDWYSSSQQPHVEDDYYGSILPSMLNFYIATQSTVFIGVSKSSWSTDVWTTRYYQGKGHSNFEYTPDGIRLLPNGGLPQPHGNCV